MIASSLYSNVGQSASGCAITQNTAPLARDYARSLTATANSIATSRSSTARES